MTVGQDAADDSFQVWDTGDVALSYTVADDVGWLSVSPSDGTSTGSGDKQTHTVSYTTSSLTAGTYTGHITVTDAAASNSPQTLTVTLTVTAASSIGADTASLSPTCAPGGNPASDQIEVWNAGGGTLDYTVSDDAPWLSVLPTGGTSTGPADVVAHTVTYSASGLAAGTYNATITIAAAAADNSPVTIPVQLTVATNAGPTIQITWPTAADSPLSDSMITVTGTASDEDGVQAIWVNGVQALNTGTAFSTWSATIPLNQGIDAGDPNGINVITASGADMLGNYVADADSVTVQSIGGGGLVQYVTLNFQATGAAVPGDVDTYQFDAAAGTNLSISTSGSGKVKPDLLLQFYDAYGQLILTQSGSRISVKQVLPDSGLYTVRVSVNSGSGGAYKISISASAPKGHGKHNSKLATASVDSEYYVTMARGSMLSVTASSNEFTPTIVVKDPLGHPVDMHGHEQTSGGRAQIRNLQMPDGTEPYLTGDYTVCVLSGDDASGAFSIVFSSRPPRSGKLEVRYPLLLGLSPSKGVAPGGLLALKVSGASGTLADDTVFIGGQPLSVESASLKGDKGTLYVRVPAGLTPGSVEVYFRRSDSDMDEQSNTLQVNVGH